MITAYVDGACRGSNPGTCSCAFAVYDDDKLVNSCGFYLGDEHSNNYAEYQGLIKLLEWYAGSSVPMEIYCDSMLVVLQVQGIWKCEKEDLIPLRDTAQTLMTKGRHSIQHVKGHSGVEGNELADKLCNEVLDSLEKHKKDEKAQLSIPYILPPPMFSSSISVSFSGLARSAYPTDYPGRLSSPRSVAGVDYPAAVEAIELEAFKEKIPELISHASSVFPLFTEDYKKDKSKPKLLKKLKKKLLKLTGE